MAHAQRTTEIVRQPRRIPRVQLTLTEGEADFLLAVMDRIGGTPRSPRKYADRVRNALTKATDWQPHETDAAKLVDDNHPCLRFLGSETNSIYFADYPEGPGNGNS